jgi:shikimate kinase
MWLIGMMGSGKTTAGRRLATSAGVPYYDTDEMVAGMAGMPISAMWDDGGEDVVRELERRAVSEVPDRGCVAAAGGGAVLVPENVVDMTEGAPVVWLRCSPDVLARRLDDDGTRPLLAGDLHVEKRLTTILDGRETTYRAAATDVVATDEMTIEEVVTRLLEVWER